MIVAMFVKTKKKTMKTLSNVTMSMMTARITAVHRVRRIVWLCFPVSTVHFVCNKGVRWSLRCCLFLMRLYDLVLVSVVSPFSTCSHVRPRITLRLCQILPCRAACNPVRACTFDTPRSRTGALMLRSKLGIEHDLPSFKLHVLPSCRFVQHEFLNLDVILRGNNSFLHLM